MLTLYDFNGAPSPRRAKMFLIEKGIDFENVQIDLRTGEQLGEAYRAINPHCTVPALKLEDGAVLTENAEIAAYLEAAYPDIPLMGTTPRDKAEIAKWNWKIISEGFIAAGNALRNASPNMKDRAIAGPRNIAQIPELAARGQQRLAWFFEDLDARLKDNRYVAGAHYSVADINATIVVDFSRWVKGSPPDTLTALHEWHARMKERPSYSA